MQRKRIGAMILVAGGGLASAFSIAPMVSRADDTTGKLIVATCKQVAKNPNASPNCVGKCISTLHACFDEQTLEFNPTPSCEKKLQHLIDACAL